MIDGDSAEEIAERVEKVQKAGAAMSAIFDAIVLVQDWMEIDRWVQDPSNVDEAVRKTHKALDRLRKDIDLITEEVRAGLL